MKHPPGRLPVLIGLTLLWVSFPLAVAAGESASVIVLPSWGARTHSHSYEPGPFADPADGFGVGTFEVHLDGRLIHFSALDWTLCIRGTREAGGWSHAPSASADASPISAGARRVPAAGSSSVAGGMQTASTSSFAPAQPQSDILQVLNAKSYPNPFNPFHTDATIAFEITQSASVQIHIYDWAGEFVNTLDLGTLSQGSNSALWGGQTQDGRELGNGTYLARVVASTQARQESQVVKVVVWNEN